MDDAAIRGLLSRVAALERQQVRLRMGEVTGDGVDVALGGAAASYADVKQLVGTGLAGGQQVACLARGNDLLVLGGVHGQMGLPRVTSLPASPRHGQEILFETGTAGVVWRLAYNALSASAYKWEYVGGPPTWAVGGSVGASLGATVNQYVDFPSPSLQVTVPLAGDYTADAWCDVYNTAGGATFILGVGSGAFAGASHQKQATTSGANFVSPISTGGPPVTGLAAGGTIRGRIFIVTATTSFMNNLAALRVVPVRVG